MCCAITLGYTTNPSGMSASLVGSHYVAFCIGGPTDPSLVFPAVYYQVISGTVPFDRSTTSN